ncbi:hypothetical protein LDC_0083 [sediment metagenome]|uniref:Uncharacterized protein n=1 Tax=sediment metagenome TaxID=749907 RepID=D9PF05_9ZZZZ
MANVRLEVRAASQLAAVLEVPGVGAHLPVVPVVPVREVDHVLGEVVDGAAEDARPLPAVGALLRQQGRGFPGHRIEHADELVGVGEVAALERARGVHADQPATTDHLREADHGAGDVLRPPLARLRLVAVVVLVLVLAAVVVRLHRHAGVAEPGPEATFRGDVVVVERAADIEGGAPSRQLDRQLAARAERQVVRLAGEVARQGRDQRAQEGLLPRDVAGEAPVLVRAGRQLPGRDRRPRGAGSARDRLGQRRAAGAGGRGAAHHVELELRRERLAVLEGARQAHRRLDHVGAPALAVEQRAQVQLRARRRLGARRGRQARGQQQAGRGPQPGAER